MKFNRRVTAIVSGSLLGAISAYILVHSWLSDGNVDYLWLLLLLCGVGLVIAEGRRS